MATSSLDFGTVLRRHRRARGLTQEALAERARLSRDAISALERSRRRTPRPDTLALLADALELADPERASFAAAARQAQTPEVDAPELATLNNLPVSPTPLIGRAGEVEAAATLLRRPDVRFLTLTGPAGVGKTRLALAVAARVADSFADGVFVVPLGSVGDPATVVTAIAVTLGVREQEAQALIETVRAHLRQRQVLLVLDNFEHLAVAAPLLASLLAGSRWLKLLVTSRAPVHVRGERQFAVPPLAIPDADGISSAEALARVPAVALFVERAEAAAPDFKLTAANASSIAAICRRLDGLPLALELAAARTRVLSPAALLARLETPLPLLVDGALDLPERQKTMRRTLEWSYELLDEPHKVLFRRLAPFTGSFSLQAAQRVCTATGELGCDVLTSMASLVDQSLLLRVAEDSLDEPRFRMLYTIREYATERLRETEEADRVYEAHAAYYLDLAGVLGPRLSGPDQLVWLNRLEQDYDNLVAGLSWFTSSSETERATQFGIGLWQFWWLKGTYSEGRAHQEAVAALPAAPGSESARADLFSRVAEFARLQGDFEHARTYHEQSLAISRSLGDRRRVAAQLREIGRLALIEGHLDVARTVLDEALALHRALNDRHGLALVLSFIAELDFVQGNIGSGSAHLTQALELQRIFDDQSGMAVTLQLLGHAAREQGDWQGAELLLRDSLELFQQAGPSWGVAWALEGFALLAAARGQAARALRLAGAAAARREALGLLSTPLARDIFASKLAVVRLDLTDAAATEAWASGHAMEEREMLSYVRGLHTGRLDAPVGASVTPGDPNADHDHADCARGAGRTSGHTQPVREATARS
jgi:predicted ATPase/transcriptional regulator with XRE-family HTH domain